MSSETVGPPRLPGLGQNAPLPTVAGTRRWAGVRDGVPVVVHVAPDRVAGGRDRRAVEARRAGIEALRAVPGLVPVLGGGIDDGRPWWITPSEGEALDDRRHRTVAEVAALGVDLATGLGRLHAAGLVHGRVAPDAIVTTTDGAHLGVDPVPPVPMSEAAAGPAPHHVPPEVLEGRAWTPAGDLWALASTLYTLLEGHPPFTREAGQGVADVLLAITLGGRLTFHRPDVGADLRRALERGLDPDPERRPTASAFGVALVTASGAALADRLDTVSPALPVGPEHDADDASTVGRPLGSAYLLTEPIGRGAMGRVWRGVRRVDGSAVAVKVLRPELADDPDAVARFLTERSALRAVVDPHVVRVHDLVVEGSILAIVMDLVSGGDLRSALRAEGRLAPGPAIEAIGGVAAGLVAVHRAGIVHRDVKPENVLVTAGDPPVRLTDFGIARVVDGASLTRPTQLVGTPDYVAPELAAGRPPSPASDVYALGVMAYELLAGRRPFVGPSPAAVLRAHLDEAPVPPPGLDPGVWAMVAACLDKDPARRPAADEVAGWCRRAAPALEGHPRLDPVPAPPARPEASVGAVDPLSAPAVPVPPVALAGPAGDHDGGRLETRAGRRPADPAPPAAPAARRRWPWLLGAAVLALVLGVGGFATAQRDEDASPPSTDEEGSTTSDGVEIGFVGLPVDEAILQSNGRVVVRYAQPTVEDEGTSLTLVLVPADDDPAAPERQRQADFDGAGGASRDPGESDDAVLPFDEDEDGVNDAISIDPAGFDLDLEADPGACVRILHPYRGAKPEPADLGVRAFATDCTEISE